MTSIVDFNSTTKPQLMQGSAEIGPNSFQTPYFERFVSPQPPAAHLSTEGVTLSDEEQKRLLEIHVGLGDQHRVCFRAELAISGRLYADFMGFASYLSVQRLKALSQSKNAEREGPICHAAVMASALVAEEEEKDQVA